MTSIIDDREPSLVKQLPSSTEIIEGKLYLGNLASSLNLEYRTKLGITHVICVCSEGLRALISNDHQCNDDVKPRFKDENDKLLYIPVEDDEYEDILTHLPRACAFIGNSLLSPEARVLVHCKMGVSRSVTTVAAYLMKSRQMKSFDAIEYIKARRPHIHPNYGFLKQLERFEQCNYTAPSPRGPVYRSWKRKYVQDVQSYLGYAGDIVSIGKRNSETANGGSGDDREGLALYLTSDLPADLQQSRHLLREFEVTHLVVIGSDSAECEAKAAAKELGLQVHEVADLSCARKGWGVAGPEVDSEWLGTSVSGACRWMVQAIGEQESSDGQGSVLVYSPNETRGCVVVCAYLMASRKVASKEALSILQRCLPLFNPSQKFLGQLEVLDRASADPSATSSAAALAASSSLIRTPMAGSCSEKSSTTATQLAQMIEETCSLIQSESVHSSKVPLADATKMVQSATIQSPQLVSF